MEIKKKTKGAQSLGILNRLEDEDITVNKNEIDIDLIDFNMLNFYSTSDNEEDIRDLADSIREIGLMHNIVVIPNDKGRYTTISGEKRTKAFSLLYNETKDSKWKYIPCKIRDDIKNITDEEITLIKANRDVRERSETIKAKEVERLDALYEKKKASGEKVGIIRKRIAEDLGISETQVQRYRKVNELIPEFKNMLDTGDIQLTTVEHFTGFEPDVQKDIFDSLMSLGHKIGREEALNIKNEVKKVIEAAAADSSTLLNSSDVSVSPEPGMVAVDNAPPSNTSKNDSIKKVVSAGVGASVDISVHIKKALNTIKALASKLEELSKLNKKLSPENKEQLKNIKKLMEDFNI